MQVMKNNEMNNYEPTVQFKNWNMASYSPLPSFPPLPQQCHYPEFSAYRFPVVFFLSLIKNS